MSRRKIQRKHPTWDRNEPSPTTERASKKRTDMLALLIAWNDTILFALRCCWAFLCFCCSSTRYVKLYGKWALFFCWAPSKSRKCPAKERKPDVVSFAGRLSEGGRDILLLSLCPRPHASRNILRQFVKKRPRKDTTIRFLSLGGCFWLLMGAHGSPKCPFRV